MFSKHEETTFDICEFCRYNPPSSFGGRPCTVCPASGREIKTNADRIKAMRDEEQIKFFSMASKAAGCPPDNPMNCMDDCSQCWEIYFGNPANGIE